MPVFRAQSEIPVLTGNTSADLKRLRIALYQLEENLRYMFNNIDSDNLSDELAVSINDALIRFSTDATVEIDTAGIMSMVQDEIGNAASRFEQAADEIISTVEQKILESVGFSLQVVSSNGSIFKNGEIETTLSVVLMLGKEDVTDDYSDTYFRWTRVSADTTGDEVWNARNASGEKSILITSSDVVGRATFFCTFTEPISGARLVS